MNKVFLLGNLTRDPELKYTPNGKAVTSFGLAINEKYKQGEEMKEKVHFFDIKVWGNQAKNCVEYLNKGSKVLIEGKLDYQAWETEGVKKSRVEVMANYITFLSAKKASKPTQEGSNEVETQGVDDDIPF